MSEVIHLPPRDAIEAETFSRDAVLADFYGLPDSTRLLWLTTRALARRDPLWLSRQLLGLTRLEEDIHRPPANFCVSIVTTPNGFGNLRDPRGSGKTSLATRTMPIWCVIQDPIECAQRGWPFRGRESRLGISTLKEEFTNNLMRVLMGDLSSEILRWTFPELLAATPKRWTLEGIELNRGLHRDLAVNPLFAAWPELTRFPDPTFARRSLDSGSASAHTHGEFIDDPVNEKTWNSKANIDSATHGIRQSYSIVRPEMGFRLVAGNSWAPHDVVANIDEDANWRVFLRSLTACAGCRDGYPTDSRGLVPLGRDGLLAHHHEATTFPWTMRLPTGAMPDPAEIRAAQASTHIYMAQYENNPMAGEATMWDSRSFYQFDVTKRRNDATLTSSDSLRWYAAKADIDGVVPSESGRIDNLYVTITYDPAHGSVSDTALAKSSRHAITAMARTGFDTVLCLEAWAGRMDNLDAINRLVDMILRLRPKKVGVESVGYQKTVKSLLARELRSRRVGWLNFDHDIVPIPRGRKEGDKETYVRSALGHLINAHQLHLCPLVPGYAEFTLALDTFPVSVTDVADSMAMHPNLWTARRPSTIHHRELRRKEALLAAIRKKKGAGVTGYGW